MPRPAKVMTKKNLASNKHFINFEYNVKILYFTYVMRTNKTSSVVWSGSMDDDEEGRTRSANFRKENI
jgi:hypothetical protein